MDLQLVKPFFKYVLTYFIDLFTLAISLPPVFWNISISVILYNLQRFSLLTKVRLSLPFLLRTYFVEIKFDYVSKDCSDDVTSSYLEREKKPSLKWSPVSLRSFPTLNVQSLIEQWTKFPTRTSSSVRTRS